MILFRILILLSIVAASVGSAIAKENEPFLPVKNTETTSVGSAIAKENEPFLPVKNTETTSVGLVATKEKESFLPVKNAKTKTKRGRRRTTIKNIEKIKAGKASPPNPNSDEVVLKRKRERKCSTAQFEGKFVYQNGCDGDPWEVTITCDKKGRNEDRRSGVTCTYYEENLNEDLDKCAYSGDFVSKEALSTDGQGNCELGPFSIHPVTVDDEDCKENYPELDVKIIAVNKDELRIYFSRDGGKTYYNQGEPRLAIRIPEHDADGMNSGGSSSKGGKKGTNDRRKLVENTLRQVHRKLGCLFGTVELGQNCEGGGDSSCIWGYHCRQWLPDLYGIGCPENQKHELYPTSPYCKKCYKYVTELGDACGHNLHTWCDGSTWVYWPLEEWGHSCSKDTDGKCTDNLKK